MSHESSIQQAFDWSKLIDKYLRGQQTAREEKQLLAWLLEDNENQRLFKEISHAGDDGNPWDERSPNINSVIHQIWLNISTSNGEKSY
jgi:hypothetical protein